jgi:uncharacterized protein YodC (DUF2158 family)
MSFAIGDLVRAKCGGPIMMITFIHGLNQHALTCMYYNTKNGSFISINLSHDTIIPLQNHINEPDDDF